MLETPALAVPSAQGSPPSLQAQLCVIASEEPSWSLPVAGHWAPEPPMDFVTFCPRQPCMAVAVGPISQRGKLGVGLGQVTPGLSQENVGWVRASGRAGTHPGVR